MDTRTLVLTLITKLLPKKKTLITKLPLLGKNVILRRDGIVLYRKVENPINPKTSIFPFTKMQCLARSLSKSTGPLLNSRARQSWVLSEQCHSTLSAKKSSSRNHGGSIVTESVSPAKWPKPTEIPYQPKIANSTDLIGFVNQPVEFHAKPDGSFWAGTVITHGPPSGSGSDTHSDSIHKFWLGFEQFQFNQKKNEALCVCVLSGFR